MVAYLTYTISVKNNCNMIFFPAFCAALTCIMKGVIHIDRPRELSLSVVALYKAYGVFKFILLVSRPQTSPLQFSSS